MIFYIFRFKFISVFIKVFFIISFLIVATGLKAQTKTNLDIFYSLVDSSADQIIAYLPQAQDSVKLDLNLGESYSIFGNKIIAELFSSGKRLTTENEGTIRINYVIEDAKVTYGGIYRDGFFGDYFIPRFISLKGNFLTYGNPQSFNEFNFSFNDSIRFDEIHLVENESYPFTKGDIPPEPFFSGLFEPVIAIGTAALAIILFFTVRSK